MIAKRDCVIYKDIDLDEIETLRKWIKYRPECYLEKLGNKRIRKRDESDKCALTAIQSLYNLIENVEGKINLDNKFFNFKRPTLRLYRELDWCISSIPNFDVNYYANLKLTDEERQFAYDFMKKCNRGNSYEMMKYAKEYPNFFISCYMVYLLDYHPESNYIYASSIDSIKSKRRKK